MMSDIDLQHFELSAIYQNRLSSFLAEISMCVSQLERETESEIVCVNYACRSFSGISMGLSKVRDKLKLNQFQLLHTQQAFCIKCLSADRFPVRKERMLEAGGHGRLSSWDGVYLEAW
jgi:hypothetical protein